MGTLVFVFYADSWYGTTTKISGDFQCEGLNLYVQLFV